jgi:signal transduction histidine kinase
MTASTAPGFFRLEKPPLRDRAEDELAVGLGRVLKISVGVLVLSAASVPFSMRRLAPTLVVHVLFALFLLGSCVALRAGRRRTAGGILSGGFWLVATGAVFAFGGVRSPGLFVYLPIVATAALFWSRRAATLLAIASACSVLVAAQLEALGALPRPLAPIPPERLLTVFIGSLVMTAVLFLSAVRRLGAIAHELAQSKTLLEDLATAQARAESERTELEHRLRSVERLESVGRLAGGVAHDFNNLLSVILNSAALLRREVPRGSIESELVGEIDEATMRATELVKRLMASSGRSARTPRLVELNAVVAGLSSILQRIAGSRTEIVVDARATRSVVHADLAELEQVILNLALNARDAMPRGGRLGIETMNVASRDGSAGGVGETHRVALVVRDEGVGMDAATASRIFEPFFTTKGSAGGTGLGLASVKRIVDDSGGTIHVESSPGRGARFEIVLPCAPGAGTNVMRADEIRRE